MTGVPRVGGLAGPDLDGLRAVLALRRPVIAAGGIASLDDVLAMRDAGAEGAIVGRAAWRVAGAEAVLRALGAAEGAVRTTRGRRSELGPAPLDSVPPMGFLTDLVAGPPRLERHPSTTARCSRAPASCRRPRDSPRRSARARPP